MKKAITKKYYIESVLADSITTKIEVSATKFKKAYEETEKQFNNQEAQEGDEFYIERNVKSFDHERHIETWTEFTFGCSSTYFTVLECKEGYRFKK